MLSLSLFELTTALLYAIKPVIKQDIAKKVVQSSGWRIIESNHEKKLKNPESDRVLNDKNTPTFINIRAVKKLYQLLIIVLLKAFK